MNRPLVLLLAALIPLTAGADDDPAAAARRATRQLSAAQSLRARLDQAETYAVTRDALAARIKADEKKHRSARGAVDVARAEQREGYEAAYSRSVREVAHALDPANKIDLIRWLRDYADSPQPGQRISLKEAGKQRQEKYLASDEFATAYALARKKVADEQASTVRPGLAEGDYPSTADIEKAHNNPAARAALIGKGGDRLIPLKKSFLEEAEKQVEELASRLVAHGLNQLDEQLRVLTASPRWSPTRWGGARQHSSPRYKSTATRRSRRRGSRTTRSSPWRRRRRKRWHWSGSINGSPRRSPRPVAG